MSPFPAATTPRLVTLSLFIQLLLLVYAHHIDTHPERYGGLKYTDVDWRVVADGLGMITHGPRAQGWLVQRLGLAIGDPYARPTFRYSPLLPLVLSPTLLHPLLGRLVLVLSTLAISPLLLALGAPFWPTHLIWTLNPFVLNITTRGSPEALVLLFVVAVVYCLSPARDRAAVPKNSGAWRGEDLAAGLWALGVAWKIYPLIYAPAIWTKLAKRHGWLGLPVWRFGAIALATFVGLNLALWSIWGHPFLHHTYLYHLTRLDHRHNFSPYFYPIYLSLFPSSTNSPLAPTPLESILRHPLASFLPQALLCGLAGFALPQRTSLAFAMFVQTWGFVIFNKVCTSQYFLWPLPLLPLILPNLHIPPRKATLMLSLWIAAQAIWLGTAYRLEFKGESVYLQLWTAGIGLFATSVWVLGEVISGWRGGVDAVPRKGAKMGSAGGEKVS